MKKQQFLRTTEGSMKRVKRETRTHNPVNPPTFVPFHAVVAANFSV